MRENFLYGSINNLYC